MLSQAGAAVSPPQSHNHTRKEAQINHVGGTRAQRTRPQRSVAISYIHFRIPILEAPAPSTCSWRKHARIVKIIMRPLLSTTNHVHTACAASQAPSISSRLNARAPPPQNSRTNASLFTDRPCSPARAAESGSEYYEGHSSAPLRTPRPQLHIGPHMTSVASPRYNVRASPFAFSSVPHRCEPTQLVSLLPIYFFPRRGRVFGFLPVHLADLAEPLSFGDAYYRR